MSAGGGPEPRPELFRSSAHRQRYRQLLADRGFQELLLDYTADLDHTAVRDGLLTGRELRRWITG